MHVCTPAHPSATVSRGTFKRCRHMNPEKGKKGSAGGSGTCGVYGGASPAPAWRRIATGGSGWRCQACVWRPAAAPGTARWPGLWRPARSRARPPCTPGTPPVSASPAQPPTNPMLGRLPPHFILHAVLCSDMQLSTQAIVQNMDSSKCN